MLYIEVDMNGKEYSRRLKEDADIETLKKYGNKRINDRIIASYYFKKERPIANKADKYARQKEWTQKNRKNVNVYLAIEEYDLVKERANEMSVAGYIRMLVRKDLGMAAQPPKSTI